MESGRDEAGRLILIIHWFKLDWRNVAVGSINRLSLYQHTQSSIANSTSSSPFHGLFRRMTAATALRAPRSINYRLWPCRNRPRESPETLAKIETRAMGFLATPKARSARSLASASTPASRHPISTRSGCSCGSYESSWNAVAGRRSSLSKRSSPDPGGARRETVYSTLRAGAR